jgi:hypothetical protein
LANGGRGGLDARHPSADGFVGVDDLSGSMPEAEESILQAVNRVGNVATGEALKRFGADGDPIMVGGAKWYSKGKVQKICHTPHGVVSAERHVYQPVEGGKTFCPMDSSARIIRKATPRFAKIVMSDTKWVFLLAVMGAGVAVVCARLRLANNPTTG